MDLRSLTSPQFAYTLAQTVAAVGTVARAIAVPLLAVLDLHATPFDVALLGALTLVPGLGIGILGSGWLDRVSARTFLITAEVLRLGAVLTIPLAAVAGTLSIPVLAIATLGIGSADALVRAVEPPYLTALMDARASGFVSAYGKLHTAASVLAIATPAAVGALVGAFGALPVTTATTASVLVTIALLLRLPDPRPEGMSSVGSSRGLELVWRRPDLRRLVAVSSIYHFGWQMIAAVQLVFLVKELSLSPGGVGLVCATASLGSAVAGVIAARVVHRFGEKRALTAGIITAAGLSMPFALLHEGADVVVPALLSFAIGVGAGTQGCAEVGAFVRATPTSERARAGATFNAAGDAMGFVGALIGGEAASTLGMRVVMVIGALTALGAAPLVSMRRPGSTSR